jgi:hypothetical protein
MVVTRRGRSDPRSRIVCPAVGHRRVQQPHAAAARRARSRPSRPA